MDLIWIDGLAVVMFEWRFKRSNFLPLIRSYLGSWVALNSHKFKFQIKSLKGGNVVSLLLPPNQFTSIMVKYDLLLSKIFSCGGGNLGMSRELHFSRNLILLRAKLQNLSKMDFSEFTKETSSLRSFSCKQSTIFRSLKNAASLWVHKHHFLHLFIRGSMLHPLKF